MVRVTILHGKQPGYVASQLVHISMQSNIETLLDLYAYIAWTKRSGCDSGQSICIHVVSPRSMLDDHIILALRFLKIH